MEASDFLKREAQTPLRELLLAGDALCEIRTNSESILEAARESFPSASNVMAPVDFALRLWMDPRRGGAAPWPKPYVRGLGHLVFAGFASGSGILINLRRRQAIGRLSQAIAEDRHYWKQVILPMLLSIVSGSLGIAEIHAACVAKNGRGLLLAGPSGSGKSTLTLALSQVGFGVLSDDRVYCSLAAGRLRAWGTPAAPKLRADAVDWFPELRGQSLQQSARGEQVFRCDENGSLHFRRVQVCEPRAIFVLRPQQGSGCELRSLPPADVVSGLSADLMAEFAEDEERQTPILEAVASLPCQQLLYDAPPPFVAKRIAGYFDELERSH